MLFYYTIYPGFFMYTALNHDSVVVRLVKKWTVIMLQNFYYVQRVIKLLVIFLFRLFNNMISGGIVDSGIGQCYLMFFACLLPV